MEVGVKFDIGTQEAGLRQVHVETRAPLHCEQGHSGIAMDDQIIQSSIIRLNSDLNSELSAQHCLAPMRSDSLGSAQHWFLLGLNLQYFLTLGKSLKASLKL